MTDNPASEGSMAAERPAMPLPKMSTSTDVENDTWGWPSTPAPSAEGAAAELHDDSRGTAAKAAEAPTSLKKSRRFM